jgi:hypothetical protein
MFAFVLPANARRGDLWKTRMLRANEYVTPLRQQLGSQLEARSKAPAMTFARSESIRRRPRVLSAHLATLISKALVPDLKNRLYQYATRFPNASNLVVSPSAAPVHRFTSSSHLMVHFDPDVGSPQVLLSHLCLISFRFITKAGARC